MRASSKKRDLMPGGDFEPFPDGVSTSDGAMTELETMAAPMVDTVN